MLWFPPGYQSPDFHILSNLFEHILARASFPSRFNYLLYHMVFPMQRFHRNPLKLASLVVFSIFAVKNHQGRGCSQISVYRVFHKYRSKKASS